MRIVMRGAEVVSMDPAIGTLEQGTVVIEDDRIVEVVEGDRAWDGDTVVDLTGHALVPGLVDLHMHGRPGRALGDGLTLREWHDRYPDNMVRRMGPGDAWLGAVASCGELLLGGTTTILAMPNFPGEFGRGCLDVGIRAAVAAHATDIAAMADSCDSFESNLAAVVANVPFDEARVRYWFGFEHQNAATDDLVTKMHRAAVEYGTGLTSHLCESARDVDRHVELHGERPVARYDRLGALDERALFAHGNWLTPEEIDLLAARGTALVHNPVSNMRMGTGIADILRWAEAGVRFGLGTDGMLSSYRLDMFEVMRAAAMLARITAGDPQVMPARQVLHLATQGGADALGWGAEIGSLTPGKRADVVALDMRSLHLAPRVRGVHDNLEALIVFCAGTGDVRQVLVDGVPVVRDGALTTVDEADVVGRLQDRIGPLGALFPDPGAAS
ncbi:MAG: amidohydrolase family protein [Acidimicrobiia bacterium]